MEMLFPTLLAAIFLPRDKERERLLRVELDSFLEQVQRVPIALISRDVSREAGRRRATGYLN